MRDRVPFLPGSGPRAMRPLAALALIFANQAVPVQAPLQALQGQSRKVDFAREVLPVLRGSCWDCHGPLKHKGGLRLDSREALLRGGDEGPAAVPGKPGESELLRRVRLPAGHDEVMPARGTPLEPAQIEALRLWIESGAPWKEDDGPAPHWSYDPPVRPALPSLGDPAWPRTPLDAFVLARLEREDLTPAPPAERAELARRASLDLIGLPPTPEEVEAFVGDPHPDAYERLVERLLASPQFGVRWARPWLDYARYADSHGFQADDLRDLWAYRDWVVDALNADMPFDRFTIEQLAGDLLPDATISQLVATGFNRAAPCNVELGSDPEETRVNQVIDRVNTLGTVWLGTTLACAQCHDHKYDPFSMRDYYGMFAFFNQTEIEAERFNPDAPGSIQFLGPEIALIDPQVEAERTEIQARLERVATGLADRRRELGRFDPAWESELRAAIEVAPRKHELTIATFDSLSGSSYEILGDGSVLLGGEPPERDTYTITGTTGPTEIRAFELETLTDPSLPGNGPGRGDERKPAFQLNEFEVSAVPAGSQAEGQRLRFVGASADHSQGRHEAAMAIDGDPTTGWAIGPRFHEPHWARFECAQPVELGEGTRLVFRLVQDFGQGRTIGRLRLGVITGPGEGTPIPQSVCAALRLPPEERSAEDSRSLLDYRASLDAQHAELLKQERELEAEIRALQPPTTLVMKPVTKPRPTTLFLRGDFRTPGEALAAHLPVVLRPRGEALAPSSPGVIEASARAVVADDGVPSGSVRDRMDLARWLVSPANPLVARVTVNRWWAEVFGHGLVTTLGDFGVRGEAPTHPQLLDWLAVELIESGWSMKHVLRTILVSSTYRQSARVSPELLERDPRNLLYARGPRVRMEAEMIRDNALAIAGLLDLEQGGPPIRPYQPNGLWSKVGGKIYEYEVSPGTERFRRGLYVILRRSAPYPSFVTFDMGPRMACQVERERSNTPLQALTMLNDPVYVEAAVAFAQRVLQERPQASPAERIEHAFRLAVARSPRPTEREVLLQLYQAQREAALSDPSDARVFAAEYPVRRGLAPEELSAWYAVSATLLNLDETITK